MPNYADYEVQIKGTKENVLKMRDIFKQENYEDGPHMYRIFDAFTSGDPVKVDDGEYVLNIGGYCAWSLHVCMFPDSLYFTKGTSPNAVDILTLSKQHDVQVEMYSAESGQGFQEHYYINKGELVIDDIAEDYISLYTDDYESVDEVFETFGVRISEEEFKNEEFVDVGGFENWNFDAIK